jgi:hypothetical protein
LDPPHLQEGRQTLPAFLAHLEGLHVCVCGGGGAYLYLTSRACACFSTSPICAAHTSHEGTTRMSFTDGQLHVNLKQRPKKACGAIGHIIDLLMRECRSAKLGTLPCPQLTPLIPPYTGRRSQPQRTHTTIQPGYQHTRSPSIKRSWPRSEGLWPRPALCTGGCPPPPSSTLAAGKKGE